MNKRLKKSLLLLVAILLLTGVQPVTAQNGDGFDEPFDNATLTDWEHSSEVIVTEGILRMNPGSFALRFGDWDTINLSVKFKKKGEGDAVIGYSFRDGSAYFLHILNGEAFLERIENDTPTELGNSQFSSQDDTWYTLKISVSENTHQISLDDSVLIQATEDSMLEPGAIMLQCHGESICEFDDLSVKGTPGVPIDEPGHEAPPEEIQPQEEGMPEEGASVIGDPPTGLQDQPVLTTPESKQTLIDEFFSGQGNTLTLTTFVINMFLAALSSYILSRVYVHWGSSLSNRRKFAQNFMLVTISTTFIILVVRSSIALSLGLVGALSIIRFRTAVKDPEELAYLFFAIGLGIGLGDNQRLITLLALTVAIIILGLMRIFRQSKADQNFHLIVGNSGSPKITEQNVLNVLKTHCSKWQLMRLDETPELIEMAFLVEFRKMEDFVSARQALHQLSERIEISFLENKGLE